MNKRQRLTDRMFAGIKDAVLRVAFSASWPLQRAGRYNDAGRIHSAGQAYMLDPHGKVRPN